MNKFPRDLRLDDGGADDGMVWAMLGVGGCGLKGWRRKDLWCLEWSKPHQTDCSQSRPAVGYREWMQRPHPHPYEQHNTAPGSRGFSQTCFWPQVKSQNCLKSSWLLAT